MSIRILGSIRGAVRRWFACRIVLVTLTTIGVLAWVAVVSDAAFDFSEATRSAAFWIFLLALPIAAAAGFYRWRRLTDERLARMFEDRDPSLGSRLVNAVQLAREKPSTPAAEIFRDRAVELGRQAAAKLEAWPVMRDHFKNNGRYVVAVIFAWAVLVFLDRDLVGMVLPRFYDPHGDHPPFSRVRIDVAPGRTNVLYGGELEIRAAAKGLPVEKLWLVAKSGTNETRAMMLLAPDRSFFQTLENLREPTDYYVTDGHSRSPHFAIGIRRTPQIAAVRVTTVFPGYTGKPSHTENLADDPQSLPKGTRVTFRVTSNRPLKSGTLELTPVLGGGKPVQILLQPEAQNDVVSGSFVFTNSVTFEVSVNDVENLASTENKRGRFNLLPDHPPRLVVMEPGRDAVATPSVRVPVRVQASDDYAVSSVVWLRGYNSSADRPFTMKLDLKNGAKSVEATGTFALDELGVRPGDVIDYYFEAADNDPDGPNVAISRPFRLEIISKEQYESVLRQAAARKALFETYFKLNAWMRRMAENARNLEKESQNGDPNAAKDAAALADQLKRYTEELNKFLQTPEMFDIDESFRSTLAAEKESLSAAASKLSSVPGGGVPNPDDIKAANQLLNDMAKTQDEQIEKPAREIVSVVKIVSDANTFVKLAQQQAVLAGMLQRFADSTNALSHLEQAEVQELTRREEQISRALHELLATLPEQLKQVPADSKYDPLRNDVGEFLKAVAQAGIEEDLTNAVKVLGQPDTMTGHALAQQAAEKMDKLVGRCNGMPQQGQQCLTSHFQPKLTKPGVGNTLQQILQAMKTGNGQGGEDGYGLFNEDVALYGPNVELAGEQAGGQGIDGEGRGQTSQTWAAGTDGENMSPADALGRIRLQPNAKFPLRYRELVGEYFRVIAETPEKGNK